MGSTNDGPGGGHADRARPQTTYALTGALSADELEGYLALGELALDGRISPVASVLPAAIHALAEDRAMICPAAQGGEAAAQLALRDCLNHLGLAVYNLIVCPFITGLASLEERRQCSR